MFAAVAAEVAQLLDAPAISMVRFEADETSTAIAVWGDENPFGVGATFDPWPGVMLQVRQTGQPARLEDFAYSTGPTTARLQAARIHSGVGVPINVDGRVWGTIIALATRGETLPVGIEERLSSFTELVATAIANAQARDELDAFAREQEALRRVATVAATGGTSAEVFRSVVSEVKELLDLPVVALTRYEPDGMVLMVATAGDHPFTEGSRWPLDGLPVASLVLERRAPARLDEYVTDDPDVGAAIRQGRVRSGLAVPIMVDNEVWGTISTASTDQVLRPDTERRLTAFTELVGSIVLRMQARDDLRALADEQAALRHVATLVARGAEPREVFGAVCEVTGELVGATSVNLCEFTPDGFNLTLAGWSLRDTHVPTGTRLPLTADTINGLIRATASAARMDSYEEASGDLGTLIRERGIRSEVGAPVIVNGHVWGALIAGTDADKPLPASVETRLSGFTELVATAVSNAATSTQLLASRARLVTAGDDARRRIERDLHDGTQQRLVSLGLDLQTVQASLPREFGQAHDDLARIGRELESVLEEVRELSRGLHPALLTQGGLHPALRALARRSPIRVELEVEMDSRPPEAIEIATYYVVSEALTNAAKHASPSSVTVVVTASRDKLRATIEDDGIGGAEVGAGSGLLGLIDRVEALGGQLAVDSPRGKGTRIAIELPLS